MATLAVGVNATEELWTVSESIPDGLRYFTVGDEIVEVTADFPAQVYSPTGLTTAPKVRVDRGVAGSTAAAHLSGVTLTPIYSPSVGGGPGGALTVTDGVTSVEATTASFPADSVTDAGGGEAAVSLTRLEGLGGPAGEGGQVDTFPADANAGGSVTVAGGQAVADKTGGNARIQGGSGDAGATEAAFIQLEGGDNAGNDGRIELVGAEIAFTTLAMGFFSTGAVTRPQVPASPTEQDIVDALVALGLITQAAP